MTTAFLLWHVPEGDEYGERAKLCGVYSSEQNASAAIGRLREKPGFADYQRGFSIDTYGVDLDQWTEGFGVAQD